MEYPERKRLRLIGFDYSTNGAYFITICTHNRVNLFGDVGADSISAQMIANTFEDVIEQYSDIYCPNYIVMPNHFHAIIVIEKEMQFAGMSGIEYRADIESAPTISEIVQSFKRYSTLKYIKMVNEGVLPPFDKKIWPRSFHDHIIRNEKEYCKIYEYITNNPITWESDCFYQE